MTKYSLVLGINMFAAHHNAGTSKFLDSPPYNFNLYKPYYLDTVPNVAGVAGVDCGCVCFGSLS